ncbi:MAG: hypothetical protein ACOYNI_06575 [Acidimicrobiia bacterium]
MSFDPDHDAALRSGFDARFVQPYEAVKEYRCPGCDHEIRVGEHHVVVVPTTDSTLRRHWHKACWNRRS